MKMSVSWKVDGKLSWNNLVGVQTLISCLINKVCCDFSGQFRNVVDTLNSQYLFIRHTGQNLYEEDTVRLVSAFSIGECPVLCGEMVNWDVAELILGPWKQEDMKLYDTLDSGDGLRWEGSRPKRF